jgi:glutamate 5-kinase
MQIAALNDERVCNCEFWRYRCGKQFVKLESKGKEIIVKQALASIGQPHLMRIFHENFSDLGLLTSQCLLSYSDFERPIQDKLFTTINILIENNYIP